MMELLDRLQFSAFGMWVVGAPTIWAYPTILMLHTVGLGVVVGTSVILDLKLLGFANGIPLAELERLYRPLWVGFGINLVTGVCLFIGNATGFGYMLDFYVKLTLIALALIIAVRLRRLIFVKAAGTATAAQIPLEARVLAGASLALWVGAIAAGRLMAYIR